MAVPNDASPAADRRRILNRLRRLGGQVRGLAAMIANDKSCEDVLTQVMAAKSALDRVGLHAIAYAVKCCRTSPDDRPALVVDEAMSLFLEYARPERGVRPSAAPAGSEATATAELLAVLDGHVSALERLVSEDSGCDEILVRVAAARSVLDQVGLNVVAHAMRTCMAPQPGADRDEVVDQALTVFIRYIGTAR